MFGRNKIAMLVAEFLGTAFLTAVVLGVQRSTLGLPYFIAIAAGIAVAYGIYVFGNVSGGQFNPALTIALWAVRRVKTTAALLYIVVQMLGGWAAYGVYHYFVNSPVQEINVNFTWRILIAEGIGALIFGLAWAAAAYNKLENTKFAAVAGVGFALAILVASAGSTAAVANPAIALGTRDFHLWTSVLGPIVGALVGVGLYSLLFAPKETLVAKTVVAEEEEIVEKPSRSRAAASRTRTTTRTTTVKKTPAKRRKTTRR